jgi:hypothetical protein
MAEGTELTYEGALALKEEVARSMDAAGGPLWRVVSMPSAQAAADFLNRPPRQRAGEASVTNRPDGSVDVYFLSPI